MLDTQDFRQDTDSSCGDVAQDIVFAYFGVRPPSPALSSEPDGLHPAVIEATFRKAGLRVQSGQMNLRDLKHHIAQGRLVLCPIDLFGGHWVVVRGITPSYVHYQCPTEGRQKKIHESWVGLWRDSTRSGHAFDKWGIAVWRD